MSDFYILIEGRVRQVPLLEWAKWFEEHSDERRVAYDVVPWAVISTVFLGIDHSFGFGQKQIFETMVFSRRGHHKAYDQYTRRYGTLRKARVGHSEVLKLVGDLRVVK
jgi:hypothetical protein